MPNPIRPRRPNSFSLIEMLVVLAIAAIVVSFTLPSIIGLTRGSSLTSGGNRLAEQMDLARQLAMSKNCQVEFRFYQLPDANASVSGPPVVYRAFQSFSLDNSGRQTNAITKVIFLPNQVYVSANTTASTLLGTGNPPTLVAGTTAGVPLGIFPPSAYNYVDFHFRSDGSTDLDPAVSKLWFVSLANQNDKVSATTGAANLPVNYITVQLDARTGRTRTLRPN